MSGWVGGEMGKSAFILSVGGVGPRELFMAWSFHGAYPTNGKATPHREWVFYGVRWNKYCLESCQRSNQSPIVRFTKIETNNPVIKNPIAASIETSTLAITETA